MVSEPRTPLESCSQDVLGYSATLSRAWFIWETEYLEAQCAENPPRTCTYHPAMISTALLKKPIKY